MTKIPSIVRVGGMDYTVGYPVFIELDGSRNYQGVCRYDITQIQVLENLSVSRKEEVFIHELLHACLHEAGFEEQDEDQVNRLGKVLYQVLKDNKLYFGE